MKIIRILLGVAIAMYGIWGEAGGVRATPSPLVITAPQGVVEFKKLVVDSSDGASFTVTNGGSVKGFVSLNSILGTEGPSLEILVYLASTLREGKYSDTIVLEIKGHDPLKIPVEITILKEDPKLWGNDLSARPRAAFAHG